MKIQNTKDVGVTTINILVHAPAGSGKTRLCATTGEKALVLSAESGLLSIKDAGLDFVNIDKIEDMTEAYQFLAKGDHDYKWVCIDSVSEIAEVLLSQEKAKVNDPRQAYGQLQERMMNLLRRFRDLPMNVYFSAKQSKSKDEVTGGLLFAPSAPGTKLGGEMPYIFDEVFALHSWRDDEGDYQSTLQTQRDNQYDAKDRSGKLEFNEPADLAYIYKKIIG